MDRIALVAILAALAAGCASPSAGTDPAARRERAEATTGSNIPRRNDGTVTTYDREAVQRSQEMSYGAPRPTN